MSEDEYSYFNKETHEPIGEIELHEVFDDYLDEAHGTTKIAGMTYDTSNALKQVDPVAYEQEYDGWLDSELGQTYLDKDGLDEAVKEKKDELLERFEDEDLDTNEKMDLYDEVMETFFPCSNYAESDTVIDEIKKADVNGQHVDFTNYLENDFALRTEQFYELKERKSESGELGNEQQIADMKEIILFRTYEMYDTKDMSLFYGNETPLPLNPRDQLRTTLEAKQTPTIEERWAQKPTDEGTEAQDKPKNSNTFKR